MKFNTLNSNINTTWDLVEQKISLYETRIQILEKFQKEKIQLQNTQPAQDSCVYSAYQEKLNSKIEELVKSNNELTFSLKQKESDYKLCQLPYGLMLCPLSVCPDALRNYIKWERFTELHYQITQKNIKHKHKKN